MSVIIDNEEVFIGDSVYDVIHGNGIVTQVTGTSFSADYSGKVYNYATGGFYNGFPRQRVFWSDPIIGHPTKNDAIWSIVSRMVIALLDELRGARL